MVSPDLFVPILTRRGKSIFDIPGGVDSILVYGTGVKAKQFMKYLRRNLPSHIDFAFVRDNDEVKGKALHGVRLLSPTDIARSYDPDDSLFILTSVGFQSLVREEEYSFIDKFRTNGHLVSIKSFDRPEAIIELTDQMYFNPPSEVKHRSMGLELFNKIYAKLLVDLNPLYCLDLSGWANPLSNPNLKSILETVNYDINFSITLGAPQDLDSLQPLAVIKEGLIVLQPFMQPRDLDAKSVELIKATTLRLMQLDSVRMGLVDLRVLLTRYTQNTKTLLEIEGYCISQGIRVVLDDGYINPYDAIDSIIRSTPSDGLFSATDLVWDLNEFAERARLEKHKPCLCQRIFPVIDYQGRVRNCHLYKDYVLLDDYLAHDYSSMLAKRFDNTNCRKCQNKGYHRLDLGKLKAN